MEKPFRRMRFPLYPAVDKALQDTLKKFGVDNSRKWFPTAEDREIAERFDVAKAIREAEEQIKNKGDVVESGLLHFPAKEEVGSNRPVGSNPTITANFK